MSDVASEARTLAEGVGLVELPGRTLVEGSGADLLDYLQRMLTQDMAAVGTGRGAAACFLTPTGRVLAHLLLWRRVASPLLLDFAPGAAAAGLPALERYVIADDVTLVDRSADFARALLLGPRLADALTSLQLAAPEPGALLEGRVAGVPIALLGRAFGARASAEVLLPAADAPAALSALAAVAPRCGAAALDVARVEEGVPAYGAELDERVLPTEAGASDAVSFTKGCYPGQEPVIMAHHRGHPAQRLVRLAFTTNAAPTSGALLTQAGKTVGRVTTVVRGRDGALWGLGLVRWSLARAGLALSLPDGREAHVQ